MRNLIALFVTVTVVGLVTVTAQDKNPPEKIVFPTKKGPVAFLHGKHIERESGECTSCHDKVFPQSTEPSHKVSPGCSSTCHKANGKAFDEKAKENCVRCHPNEAPNSQ